MHNKIIYFDFDGTLVASANKIIELVNKEFNLDVDTNSWSAWNFEDCFEYIEQKEILKHFRNPDFFKDLNFIDDNMLDVLNLLKYYYNFDLRIVTIGCEENVRLKKQWIKENLPFFNLKDSHFIVQEGMGKGSIDLSDGIIIDDVVKNLETANAWHKICFGKVTEYNQQAEELGFVRTRTSLDLYLHILSLIQKGMIKK